MWGEELEQRGKKILEVIVELYIRRAAPIGSKTIARQFGLQLAPSTIRNEMAELAELGYIGKPHISAGRVPTDKGYRYYVDSIMEVRRMTQAEEDRIAGEYHRLPDDIDYVMEKTCKILSSITHQAGMVVFPRLKKCVFKRLKLVPMPPKNILVIWMTASGIIKDQVINFGVTIPVNELRRVSNFLNSELRGLPLDGLRDHLLKKLERRRDSLFHIIRQALDIVSLTHLTCEEDDLYLEGRNYILEQPEFNDLNKVRRVMTALEEKQELLEILDEDSKEDGIKCHIGKENRFEDMWECSLVTSTYRFGGKAFGTLGVLGPKRMEYSKVVAVVDYIGKLIGEVLSRR